MFVISAKKKAPSASREPHSDLIEPRNIALPFWPHGTSLKVSVFLSGLADKVNNVLLHNLFRATTQGIFESRCKPRSASLLRFADELVFPHHLARSSFEGGRPAVRLGDGLEAIEDSERAGAVGPATGTL